MNPAQLTQTLQREADRFSGPGLDVDQVLARAGEIRRGRRMRASMVMAAVVVAVSVPLGITAFDGRGATHGVGPATTSPTPIASSEPISLGDLTTGDEPANGYALDARLHHGGSSTPLPTAGAFALSRMQGGYLIASPLDQNGGVRMDFRADDGSGADQTFTADGAGSAVSPGRNVGAFVDNHNHVIAVQDAGSRWFDLGALPPAAGYGVVAVDGENCSGRSEAVGCTVYVKLNLEGGSPRDELVAIGPHSAATPVLPDLFTLNDISATGLYAGQVSSTDTGSCSEVRQGPTGNRLWHTCDYSLLSFSPDGKHLLARGAYGDGAGDNELVVLDTTTWKVVLDLKTATDDFLQQQVWEDDSHVLASVYEHGRWAVERFGLDGTREYATRSAPDPEDSYSSPFKLG